MAIDRNVKRCVAGIAHVGHDDFRNRGAVEIIESRIEESGLRVRVGADQAEGIRRCAAHIDVEIYLGIGQIIYIGDNNGRWAENKVDSGNKACPVYDQGWGDVPLAQAGRINIGDSRRRISENLEPIGECRVGIFGNYADVPETGGRQPVY